MSTRIRYIDSANGEKSSMQIFTSGAIQYKAIFNSTTFAGRVEDAVTGTVVAEVTAKSAHKIKIKLKKALKDLGVPFETESRKVIAGQDGTN